jgi:hypothetical protein
LRIALWLAGSTAPSAVDPLPDLRPATGPRRPSTILPPRNKP